MVLVMGQRWGRLGEVVVRAEDNCTAPKCSTCRIVQSAEAGEAEADMGQIAEVAAVGAA